jgi:hypothetical protein
VIHQIKGSSQEKFDEMWSEVIERSCNWLWQQRDLYRSRGRALHEKERGVLQGYYDEQTLNAAHVATVDTISNPPFYHELVQSGFPTLDISGSAGITFIDCIVVRNGMEKNFRTWIYLLFHELVHVVQYQILGPRKLVEEYIRAWHQNGYNYYDIPLEAQAYRLESQFRRSKSLFLVREVVEQELKTLV